MEIKPQNDVVIFQQFTHAWLDVMFTDFLIGDEETSESNKCAVLNKFLHCVASEPQRCFFLHHPGDARFAPTPMAMFFLL